MKNILLGLTVLTCCCMFFFNCKKEKNTPSVVQNINTDSINGDFTVNRICYLYHDSLVFSECHINAAFYQDKAVKSFTVYPQTVDVGNVSLNGVQFSNNSNGNGFYMYHDTTITSFIAPYHWQVQGANGHLGFKITDFLHFPVYSNAKSLADTLIIDQQDTINIGTYSGTAVIIQLRNSSGFPGSYNFLVKTLEYPSSSIIILPHEYSDLGIIEGDSELYVSINNGYCKSIKGKIYRFTQSIGFVKRIYLKAH